MNVAVILAGGTGSRFGGAIPKQFIEVNGQPIFFYSFMAFSSRSDIDCIVIVVSAQWEVSVREQIARVTHTQQVLFAPTGDTRQESVENALALLSGNEYRQEDSLVFIHDSARPLLSQRIIDDCMAQAKEYGGAVPALPVKDSIFISRNGQTVTQVMDRSQLVAIQTPETFRLADYLLMLEESNVWQQRRNCSASTVPAVEGGMQVRLVEGDPLNFKITTQEDLQRLITIIREK